MKKNTKGYVKLSIILYIVILSVALVSTLAWFVFKQSATIDTEEDSKIVAGEYLEICLDDNNEDTPDDWTTHIGVKNVAQFPDVSVTPDGTVWYPKALDDNDGLLLDDKGNGNYIDVTNEAEGYFVKLDLKIRSSKAVDVYLDQASLLKGMDMDKKDTAIKETTVDESGKIEVETKDEFSKDAIVGAARVAFFERDDSNKKTLTKMWVPNTSYHLNLENNDFEENCNCEQKETYKYLKVADGTVKAGDEYGVWNDKVISGENALVHGKTVGDAQPILRFTGAQTKKITVYIWVEGTDREANTLLSGGSIQYNLTFSGIQTKADSTYVISKVSYSDGKLVYTESGEEVAAGEVLYCNVDSSDPTKWIPYTSGANLDGYTKLYIRANETATQKWGASTPIK